MVGLETTEWYLGGRRVPVRLQRPPGPPSRASVLLLHGLGAAKEVQEPESEALAGAGFLVVAPDAPHHGARRTALLDAMAAAGTAVAHDLFLGLVREAAAELPLLVDHLRASGIATVGVVGISMGGTTALAAAGSDPRIAPIVSILGSPDWSSIGGAPTDRVRSWLDDAPARTPERFAPRPLLLATAGRDLQVPPRAARELAAALRPRYAACPHRLRYLEYPESEHLMRPEDWQDLWRQVIAFLRQDA